MSTFTVQYYDREISFPVDSIHSGEITTSRVKNHLLNYLNNVVYKDMTLFVKVDKQEYKLDENEVVDNSDSIILYLYDE